MIAEELRFITEELRFIECSVLDLMKNHQKDFGSAEWFDVCLILGKLRSLKGIFLAKRKVL